MRIVLVVDLYTLLPTDDYLPEKGVSTKAEFHIQNTELAFWRGRSGAVGATPVKKYHSAVPHENSAFKNFACASLILYCEHISPI